MIEFALYVDGGREVMAPVVDGEVVWFSRELASAIDVAAIRAGLDVCYCEDYVPAGLSCCGELECVDW